MKPTTIKLPNNFYLFYNGDQLIDIGGYSSHAKAIDAAALLVESTGNPVSVYKGIARIVPTIPVSRGKTREQDDV